jgi:hypothetical protein
VTAVRNKVKKQKIVENQSCYHSPFNFMENQTGTVKELKEQLEKALEQPGTLTLEQMASIWKTIVEAEQVETETANTSKTARFEKLKFWVPIIVSLVSTMALVATLIFQVFQFRENTRLMKDSEEDTQWRETLNRAKVTNGPEGAFGITLLKTFFDSSRYGSQAREVATEILGHMGDEDVFNTTFPGMMSRTDLSNLQDIANISKQLKEGYDSDCEQLTNLTQARENIQSSTNMPKYLISERLASNDEETKNVNHTYAASNDEIAKVSDAVANLLKSPATQHRSRDQNFSLTDMQFVSGTDLTNIDFSYAIIRGTEFYKCDVSGSDFSFIKDFDGSDWEGTAWWRAKKISEPLLKYLSDNWKFDKTQEYYNDQTKDDGEYEKKVEALSGK